MVEEGERVEESQGVEEGERVKEGGRVAVEGGWIGKRLGHYRLKEQIGAGGMGVVFRAADEELEREVAVKVLPPGMLEDEPARKRFRNEALALAKLNHPNVATVHEFGTQDGVDFLVTEFIEGKSLDERLREELLAPKEVLRLGAQLAEGLAAAHSQGIVHRDLKPANLRVTTDGRLKILDFGLAELMPHGEIDAAATLTQTQAVVGTLPYMAPEQLRGEGTDSRSDLWAAGAVLYELSTARRAFPAANGPLLINAILNEEPLAPSRLNKKVPPGLEAVILKSLAKQPELRYQSAKELGVDLERITAGAEPVARAKSTKKVLIGAVAGALLLGGIAEYVYTHRHEVPKIAITPAKAQRRSVAVLGFKNLAGKQELAWISTALSEMLTTELAAGAQLRVVPGENVAQMKLNLAPPETESYSKETLERIRQILGTDEVVLGSYVPLGNDGLRLDVRMQDTKGGETLAAVAVMGSEDQLDELVSKAGAELRAKLGVAEVSASQSAAVRATMPANREAARLYAEGLEKLRVFDSQSARGLLEKAVDLEPKFALSHGALGRAWSNLGYDEKAREEAKHAFELSEGLAREDRLLLEGRYREMSSDYEKAVELYQSLFTFYPDDLDYGLQLAAAQRLAGKPDAATETLGELRKFPAPLNEDPRIDTSEAATSRAKGDFKGVVAAATRAVTKGEAQGMPLVAARGYSMRCMAERNLGNPKDALGYCEKAKVIYSAAGDTAGLGAALNNMANCYYDLGDLAGAKRTYEESLAIYRKTGNESGTAGALDNIASVVWDMGKTAESKRLSQEALKIYREIGDHTGEGETLNNLAAQYVSEGSFAEATKSFEAALKIWKEIGDSNGMATALTNLGEMRLGQGQLQEAQRNYEEALKIFRETGQEGKSSYQMIGLGQVAAAQGRLAEAKKEYEGAVKIAKERDDKHQWAAGLAGIASVLLSEGDLAGAKEKYGESLKMRQEIGEKATQAESNLGLAEVALEERNWTEAERLSRGTLEEFQAEKLQEDEILGRRVLALALLGQGRAQDAKRELDAAAGMAAKTPMVAVRMEYQIAAAQVRGALGKASEAARMLETSLDEARRLGYVGMVYEIQLARGEMEMRAGNPTNGKVTLRALEKEAGAKGYLLVAKKAGEMGG